MSEEINTVEDALDIMNDLDGRDVITAEVGIELSEALGVDLDTDADIIRPTNEHLRTSNDDALAVSMADLANHILIGLGGERQHSPLVGRGSSADFIYNNALPKITDRVDDEGDDE